MTTDSQQHASLAADKDTSQGQALSPERSQQPVWSGLAQEPTGKYAPDHPPHTAAGFLTTENPSKEIPPCERSNTPPPAEHQATNGSQKSCPAPQLSCHPREGTQGSHGDTAAASSIQEEQVSASWTCPQTKRKEQSVQEMVLIIQRLQNKAARPEAFSLQQSKLAIQLISSSLT